MSIVASIRALPPSTVHRIGSSQVLVDSCSVVKELIDNAVDARATSISIEISTNTLDVIQVTDNGHGITPEDRAMVCRRYNTSKISDFSDLIELGGTSLGFRGEALHSLANLSGSLTVTTRVDSEIAAVKLLIARTGEVEGRETASRPVGTSVRATDFFNSLPVRKQTALKATAKTLTKIKRMLQAYALTRPTIRLSLKVLKAKSANGNFVYAPKSGANSVKDAALKILGNNCTSQCSWHVLQSHGFELQAFCPTPEAASQKINNIGPFLSVDSRPMTTSRGTMKQIVSLFKEKFKKGRESFDTVKDPFLCLNIVCPKANYDPNIEPSKDDVLFNDSNKVIAAVTELFTTIYPVREREQRAESPLSTLPEEEVVTDLKAGSPPQSTQRQPLSRTTAPLTRQLTVTIEDDSEDDLVLDDEEMSFLEQRARTAAWRPSMYGCDEEDLELLADMESWPPTQENLDMREAACEINPWTIAKMNSPVRRNTINNDFSPIRPVQSLLRERDESSFNSPLTPIRQDRGLEQVTPANSWTAINQCQSSDPITVPATAAETLQISAFGLPTPHPSSSPALGTSLVAIPQSTTRIQAPRPKANVNKPSINPPKDTNWGFRSPSLPKKKPKTQDYRSNKDIRDAFGWTVSRSSPQEPPLVMQGEPVEKAGPSDDAMRHEFKARLGEGEPANTSTQIRRRIETNAQPHAAAEKIVDERRSLLRMHSRPTTGVRADVYQTSEILPSDDASGPLAKRRRTIEGGKRSKSSRLPLERVPEHQQMHEMVLQVRISLRDVTSNLSRLNNFDIMSSAVPWDFDAEDVYHTFGDGVAQDIVKIWIRRIKDLLEKELKRLEVENEEEKTLACVGVLSRFERVKGGFEVEV